MVWFGMVEWLVEESTMSSFGALIRITLAIKNIFSVMAALKSIFLAIKNSGSNRQMVVCKKS